MTRRQDARTSTFAGRMPAAAVPAWESLQAALRVTVPPCAGEPAAWFSDAAADQAAAATACRSCPLLAQCRDYSRAAGERYGTWAAVHRTSLTRTRR